MKNLFFNAAMIAVMIALGIVSIFFRKKEDPQNNLIREMENENDLMPQSTYTEYDLNDAQLYVDAKGNMCEGQCFRF